MYRQLSRVIGWERTRMEVSFLMVGVAGLFVLSRRGAVARVVQAGAVTFEWPFMLWGLALLPPAVWIYVRLLARRRAAPS